MTPQRPIEQAQSADCAAPGPALRRAAERARLLAAQTGTAVVVVRDGTVQHLYRLCPTGHTQRPQRASIATTTLALNHRFPFHNSVASAWAGLARQGGDEQLDEAVGITAQPGALAQAQAGDVDAKRWPASRMRRFRSRSASSAAEALSHAHAQLIGFDHVSIHGREHHIEAQATGLEGFVDVGTPGVALFIGNDGVSGQLLQRHRLGQRQRPGDLAARPCVQR